MDEEFITVQHHSEYQAEIERRFTKSPVARFAQDFRNYVLHRDVPHINLTHRIEPESITLNLGLEPMLEWTKWSPAARDFIEEHNSAIRLLQFVDEYETIVKSFHEVFRVSFETHYEAPMKEVRSLINQWNRGM